MANHSVIIDPIPGAKNSKDGPFECVCERCSRYAFGWTRDQAHTAHYRAHGNKCPMGRPGRSLRSILQAGGWNTGQKTGR